MSRLLILQHEPEAPPALIGEFLSHAGVGYDVLHLDRGDVVPGSLGAYDGLIVLGGEASVGEEDVFPFLVAERELLAACLADGAPVLGICLGAQQLATAAGGGVVRRSVEQIGWYPFREVAEDAVVDGFNIRVRVFQYRWYTCVLPDHAVLLAEHDGDPQVFRIGDRAWGVQFHPEVDSAVLKTWFDGDDGAMDAAWPGGLKKLRKESRRELYRSSALCGRLVSNFLAVAGLNASGHGS
jgi:GMP synthase (glutamine-hydrolysing)